MKIKICGINDLSVLNHACDLGVDYVGFICANESPRRISKKFLSSLSEFNFKDVIPVFVLVNPSIDAVYKLINILPQAILQFHGEETDNFCKQFNRPFWKTILIKDNNSHSLADNFPSAEGVLLDTFSNDQKGGSGNAFNWDFIDSLDLSARFILAGGINLDNLREAISINPRCIDINSGVESDLTIKDKILMTKAVEIFNNG